jgi:hypothetical protein
VDTFGLREEGKVRENFVREIEYLLSEVPKGQWEDPGICGVMYDLIPWHKMSSLTVQTREDDPHDPADWKYYFSAESDTSRIKEEIAQYQKTNDTWVYHRLLIEAAEALLSIDFSAHGQPITAEANCLYKPFQVQVYHADKLFAFNYCEYVLARRAEDNRVKKRRG